MNLDAAFREHRARVWAVAYRMTGSASDADDLVQDTFVRAMARPPEAREGLEPWLVRVAINAGIDVLRARKRLPYIGPWLPEPIDTADACAESATARYDQMESVSFAFLIALEALTPRARAVLLLRDVFDYSVKEAAAALSMTETHVKVTHHRARKVMETYEKDRCIPTRELQEKTRQALTNLMMQLALGDVAAIESLLAEQTRTVNDSAGEYFAARVPVVGRQKVALFWTKVRPDVPVSAEVRMLNGLPALVLSLESPPERIAPKTAFLVRIGGDGLIQDIHGIVATAKLARL